MEILEPGHEVSCVLMFVFQTICFLNVPYENIVIYLSNNARADPMKNLKIIFWSIYYVS